LAALWRVRRSCPPCNGFLRAGQHRVR
jgi:hypothetical protein